MTGNQTPSSRCPSLKQRHFPKCNLHRVNVQAPQFDKKRERLTRKDDVMNRWILAGTLLICGILHAQADTDFWINMTKHPRGNDALHIDTSDCEQQVGIDRDGEPTSEARRECMRAHGWRLQRTVRQPRQKWIDPETGKICENMIENGIVIATGCLN